jgi:hypothetical protein
MSEWSERMNRLETLSDRWYHVMVRNDLFLVPLDDYSAIVPANRWPEWALRVRRTFNSLNINSSDFDRVADEVETLLAGR